MATGPGQVAMDDMSKGGDGGIQKMQKEQPVLMSRSARASPVATAGYLTITAGHLCLLRMHSQASSSDGYFFLALALVELTLAFEALVFAVGGGLQRTLGLNLLSLAGRARMLTAAMAWPWLVPWVSELGCRCGTVSLQTGAAWLHLTFGLAVFTSGFYLVREVAFMVRGEPPSALGGAPPQFGDCLPTNALLGGQFRMEKADLEVTGRAVFVPARPRQGLYIGAGLAMLSHLVMGLLHLEMPPWLLLGSICGLLARKFGRLPAFKSREEGATDTDQWLLWRREGPRLVCRAGELAWIACCLLELFRCEANPAWLGVCEFVELPPAQPA